VTASLFAIRWVGVPVPGWLADETSRLGWSAAVAMTFAWAPLAQWGHVIWPTAATAHGAFDRRRFLLLMAYVVPAIVSTHVVTGLGALPLFALATVMVVAGYTAFWLAARRHLTRADLLYRAA
jgi:hypothetical protein